MHMYNKEQKAAFIRQYTNSIATATHVEMIFNVFEPYEREWGADLCTKKAEDLQPALDKMAGLKCKTHFWNVGVLKKYVEWCIKIGVPGACDDMKNIKLPGLGNIQTGMVSSPLHLQRYLDVLFDPEEHETMDVIYRSFFWLLYSGVEKDDVFKIIADDIDFDNMTIYYKESTLPLYREGILALKKAATLNELVFKHPNYNTIIRRNRVPGKRLLRGVKSEGKIGTLISIVSKKIAYAFDNNYTDIRLSISNVYFSGLYYRMYERERAGFEVDFTDEAIRYMYNRSYSDSVNLRAKRTSIAKEFTEDYERWKLAFSI